MILVKIYYVYILRCFDGTFYVGVTNDMRRRLGQHEYGTYPNCYTFNRRPVILVHLSEFNWILEAIAFEKQLKGWSHRKKRAFVEANWQDLKRYSRPLVASNLSPRAKRRRREVEGADVA